MIKQAVTITIYLEPCAICGQLMVPDSAKNSAIFQKWKFSESDLPKQMKENGWVNQGMIVPGTDNERHSCCTCADEKRVSFTCAICHQERSGDLLYEDKYNEPECTICYETMSAKSWDAWQSDQDERHRWYYSS